MVIISFDLIFLVLTLEISVITIMSIHKANERKSSFHIHILDMSQLNILIAQYVLSYEYTVEKKNSKRLYRMDNSGK